MWVFAREMWILRLAGNSRRPREKDKDIYSIKYVERS